MNSLTVPVQTQPASHGWGGRVSMVCLVVTALLAPVVEADVWGVKSHDPASDPPTTLFRFVEGGGFFTIGFVTRSGSNLDVDGLAMNADGELYGFEVFDGSASQLLRIDTSTAVATSIGPQLVGRDIRGAVFDSLGRLRVLDAASSELLEIDPDTGAVLGSPGPLTLGGSPFGLTTLSDIAQRPYGPFIVSDVNSFYALDTSTGALQLLHTDAVPGPDGFTVSLAGLALSPNASDSQTLFTYDVTQDDDIFAYDSGSGFARSLLHPDIIPGYNAGRGDLAAPPFRHMIPALSKRAVVLFAGGILIAGRVLLRRRRTVVA